MKEKLKISDFKKGFRYEAWIGYQWMMVEYPKTGFDRKQMQAAIDKNIVRRLK